jgi:hypothetical protein
MVNQNYHTLVGKFVKIDGPDHVDHNFTFVEKSITVPVQKGEYRLSLWMAYLASVHPEIKVTEINLAGSKTENTFLRRLGFK